MNELRCPSCSAIHWVIDSDFRNTSGTDEPYKARHYKCPKCKRSQIGYTLLRQAPPEFFLQPHDMYPMSLQEFGRWFKIFIEHFPENTQQLERLGVDWYPTALGGNRDRLLGERPDVDWCWAKILAAAGISKSYSLADHPSSRMENVRNWFRRLLRRD